MGLFDFALRPGQRFSKEELRVLDQYLNSISAYSKKKYRFSHRGISDNISGTHFGVDQHSVWYTHIDINDENKAVQIDCTKYFIKDENIYVCLKNFYDDPYMDAKSRIKVPKLKKFPTFVLCIGWPANGFITEFEYNSENLIDRNLDNPHFTNKCIKEIEKNTIKFIKKNY
jgi:hypothetical protein